MTESALEKARREAHRLTVERPGYTHGATWPDGHDENECLTCAIDRLVAAATAQEDAITQFAYKRKWVLLEKAEEACAAARLAGRLEQAEEAANLCANTRSHSDCWAGLKDRRDRLRREAQKGGD